MSYHNPVLLKECIKGLNIKPDGVYVDVTFGGGGHSKAILEQLNEKGRLYAFDQDEDAKKNTLNDERFILIPQNFKFLKRHLKFQGVKKVDGILADLGVSSHQFDVAERGFSTRFEGRLDMRMNTSESISAYEIINNYTEEQISSLLFQYGELNNARAMAKKIVEARKEQKIETSIQLKNVLLSFLPQGREHKVIAQVFQAIRIEVNKEMEALKDFLIQVPEVLNKDGRLCVISYHSLEDRLVKRFIRDGLFEGQPEKDFYGNFSVPLKKVGGMITPSKEEISLNNRARSAKLRIATL
ncbi:MAG TPA: 16S rRNA (cytosine(1402)-N(4))-methyltransferase RsmH [Flavobacteriaceae bacterium]|jgi:16S rRNA (cytosine1402-N4)-methyltransferase|nr:16S rRNA (cytosine(1402)-N(4))-methyltransferase RsmH [Flavobacteriaceae bacterium]